MADTSANLGCVFYDAACPFCRTLFRCSATLFKRRGFQSLPLQTPGVSSRLGLPESDLFQEMKLQLPDGRVLGGIDSWICLLRSVWWLRPFGLLLSLPGIYAIGQCVYRWTARQRHCLGGACPAAKPRRHHRDIPFLDLP